MREETARGGTTLQERLCSVVAATELQDPIGTGSSVSRLFLYEAPTPWADSFYTADAEGTLQQRLRAAQTDFVQRLRESGELERVYSQGYPAFYGIAPDREWSSPERRRVLVGTRKEGAIDGFEMTEYFLPADSFDLVDMARTFFESPEDLKDFERFRNTEYQSMREFLVCTHGHVDICCARFGVPLYQQARAAYPQVRAWRTTHFGGHRFAPTAWEFPSGYKWAFLDPDSAGHVLSQEHDAGDLLMKVRGWSGVSTRAQVVEREGLAEFGWDWLRFKRRAEIVSDGGAEGPWVVRVYYESPEGIRGVMHGVVAVRRKLQTFGCGPRSEESYGEMNEYYVESLIES